MTSPNYKKSIMVTADAAQAFDAVTSGVAHWWTRPDQPLRQIGDRAKFSFPPGQSYWTFELTGADKPSRVEWTCVDALHIHEGQPKAIETEWLGTQVFWDIHTDAGGTRIDLEHAGLTPQLLCYDICEAGWDMFFLGSLQQYLDTGQGAPHRV
ncbi:SRPBCC domain-containing protein [uncultured Tateyamaria sp.]|uniref:SRPBCC family protein n=1 Tax=uncultured Tateyamaria sp. TaxID=455651 RepID=UPI00261B4BEC|nr:SRPBCC domain-containing protein [uncultured Tateyamaria sp.]